MDIGIGQSVDFIWDTTSIALEISPRERHTPQLARMMKAFCTVLRYSMITYLSSFSFLHPAMPLAAGPIMVSNESPLNLHSKHKTKIQNRNTCSISKQRKISLTFQGLGIY